MLAWPRPYLSTLKAMQRKHNMKVLALSQLAYMVLIQYDWKSDVMWTVWRNSWHRCVYAVKSCSFLGCARLCTVGHYVLWKYLYSWLFSHTNSLIKTDRRGIGWEVLCSLHMFGSLKVLSNYLTSTSSIHFGLFFSS